VIILNDFKEKFTNQARAKLRVATKEFDENEIIKLPEEFREKEILKITIQEKKKNLYLNSAAGYSEVFYALLHLKVGEIYIKL
jgi:hypothetical protein